MTAYYNEIDPYAAQWLRNLIDAGHIAPGVVDTRSIEDVTPNDLRGYTQCHFFAGVGVWSLALRRAGWPDDRSVWTGSCPCQPFSQAGEGNGFADERHLWPAFQWLIEQCRPAVVFGEQVASRDANPWIDLVQDDLEGVGYRVGAVPFPAASVGAPHIRDRLYWVADSGGSRSKTGLPAQKGRHQGVTGITDNCCSQCTGVQRGCTNCGYAEVSGLGYSNSQRTGWDSGSLCGTLDRENRQHSTHPADASSAAIGMANTKREQREECLSRLGEGDRAQGGRTPIEPTGLCLSSGRPSPTNGFWADADWLLCRDGKWRPVEPGTFPLVNGAAARVGRLRAYGNAINAKAARVFIEAYLDS